MFNKFISITLLVATMVVGALSSTMFSSAITASAATGVNPGFYNANICPLGEYILPTSADLKCEICPVDNYCTIANIAGPDGSVLKVNGVIQPKNVKVPCGYVYNGSTFATTQLLKADGTPDTRPRSTIDSDGRGTTSRVVNIYEIVNGVSTKVGQRTEPLTGDNNGKGASSSNQCIIKNSTPCTNGQYGNSIDGCTPCPDGSATANGFTSTIRSCVCPSGRLLIERLITKDFKCAKVPCPAGFVQNLDDKFAPDYCEKLVCDNGATNPAQCNVCPVGKSILFDGVRYVCSIPAKLSGYVYVDSNDNGIKDTNEAPIAGVSVTLTCKSTTGGNFNAVYTTTTDSNGFYEFNNLGPCTYDLVESQPAGYTDGKDSAGTGATTQGVIGNDKQTGIKISSGDNSINNNFGEKNTVITSSSVVSSSAALPKAKLSGYVYVDSNDNGNKDAGESPISGVTVTLTCIESNRNIQYIRTTNSEGFYEFLDLDDCTNYTLRESQPADYIDGKDSAGTGAKTQGTISDDLQSGISLVAGNNSVNNNFGEKIKPVVVSSSAVSSATVSSITASSIATSSVITVSSQPSVTSSSVAPASSSAASSIISSSSAAVSSSVTSSSSISSAPTAKGTISGYVYIDTNNNGIIDSTESAIAGVTVTLTGTCTVTNGGSTTTQQINITKQTNNAGFYEFTNLNDCVYTVTESQPSMYNDGKETPGVYSVSNANDQFTVTIDVAGGKINSPFNNFGETAKSVQSTSGGGDNSGWIWAGLGALALGALFLGGNSGSSTPAATPTPTAKPSTEVSGPVEQPTAYPYNPIFPTTPPTTDRVTTKEEICTFKLGSQKLVNGKCECNNKNYRSITLNNGKIGCVKVADDLPGDSADSGEAQSLVSGNEFGYSNIFGADTLSGNTLFTASDFAFSNDNTFTAYDIFSTPANSNIASSGNLFTASDFTFGNNDNSFVAYDIFATPTNSNIASNFSSFPTFGASDFTFDNTSSNTFTAYDIFSTPTNSNIASNFSSFPTFGASDFTYGNFGNDQSTYISYDIFGSGDSSYNTATALTSGSDYNSTDFIY
jgi:SdrD B-like domain